MGNLFLLIHIVTKEHDILNVFTFYKVGCATLQLLNPDMNLYINNSLGSRKDDF